MPKILSAPTRPPVVRKSKTSVSCVLYIHVAHGALVLSAVQFDFFHSQYFAEIFTTILLNRAGLSL